MVVVVVVLEVEVVLEGEVGVMSVVDVVDVVDVLDWIIQASTWVYPILTAISRHAASFQGQSLARSQTSTLR